MHPAAPAGLGSGAHPTKREYRRDVTLEFAEAVVPARLDHLSAACIPPDRIAIVQHLVACCDEEQIALRCDRGDFQTAELSNVFVAKLVALSGVKVRLRTARLLEKTIW